MIGNKGDFMIKQKKQEYRALVDFASGNIMGTSTVFTQNSVKIPKIYFDKINQFPHKYMYKNGSIVVNPEYENIIQEQLKQWGQAGNDKLLKELHKAIEEIKNNLGK